MSYSSTLQNDIFPAANQAIIFPYMDGVPAPYYAKKMIEVIGNNVLHCAKISNNRIRMYIKSRKIAENFLESGGEIIINNKPIKARWYKQERNDKKIIVSNVPPHVPHSEITKAMATHGVIPTSPMKFLRFSQEEGLTEILSERRFVYIPEDQVEKLPNSEIIKFDEEDFRAFYNDALLKCFICHRTGHTSQACEFAKSNYDQNKEESDINSSLKILENSVGQNSPENIVNQSNKRPLSDTTSSSVKIVEIELVSEIQSDKIQQSENGEEESPIKKKKSKPRKKLKTENEPLSIIEQLKPMEENYKANATNYPISFTNFRLLIDMIKGNPDPIDKIKEVTDNLEGIVKILNENYPFLSRTMKTRFTKLKKKIENYLNPPNDDQMDMDDQQDEKTDGETDSSESVSDGHHSE